jgi:hypothetical protein
MPAIAILLSVLGLVPFVVFGYGALGQVPETASRMLFSLIDYAGLILGFAGGVHWGLALMPAALRPTVRFGAGALPLVVAWIALVLMQDHPYVALAVLILGYLATVLTEHRAAQRLLVPEGYVWMRWGFSIVAVVLMIIVLVLRGIGQTIVF